MTNLQQHACENQVACRTGNHSHSPPHDITPTPLRLHTYHHYNEYHVLCFSFIMNLLLPAVQSQLLAIPVHHSCSSRPTHHVWPTNGCLHDITVPSDKSPSLQLYCVWECIILTKLLPHHMPCNKMHWNSVGLMLIKLHSYNNYLIPIPWHSQCIPLNPFFFTLLTAHMPNMPHHTERKWSWRSTFRYWGASCHQCIFVTNRTNGKLGKLRLWYKQYTERMKRLLHHEHFPQQIPSSGTCIKGTKHMYWHGKRLAQNHSNVFGEKTSYMETSQVGFTIYMLFSEVIIALHTVPNPEATFCLASSSWKFHQPKKWVQEENFVSATECTKVQEHPGWHWCLPPALISIQISCIAGHT